MRNSGYSRDRPSGASKMLGAAALFERESLLNDELRFVNEISHRQKTEAELSEVRRELQRLGLPTAIAGDRSS